MPPKTPLGRRVSRWLFFEGNRLSVTAAVLVGLFVTIVLVDPAPVLREGAVTPLFYAFSAILGGNLNLLTIVVAVNQIVFSRELKSTSQLRDEIEAIAAIRRDVADARNRPTSPVTPAAFLRAVLDAIHADLDAIRDSLPGPNGPEGDLERLLVDVETQLAEVERRLGRSSAGTVGVLRATMAFVVRAATVARRTPITTQFVPKHTARGTAVGPTPGGERPAPADDVDGRPRDGPHHQE